MKEFFSTLPRNFLASFTYKKLWLHLTAILFTYIIVAYGLDWWWYTHTQALGASMYFIPALSLGFFLPMLFPLYVILKGLWKKSRALYLGGFGLLQASLLGVLVSWLYKAFTGRIPPTQASLLAAAQSSGFQFGWLRGGVWWGWPSSHATVAFALSVAFATMYYKKHRTASLFMLVFALYIAVSVSTNVHWFSEAVAGILIGTAVGISVGTYWRRYINR